MVNITATEVRIRQEMHARGASYNTSVWSDALKDLLKDELIMMTGINDLHQGLFVNPNHSYLTVRRGPESRAPILPDGTLVWRRFSQGHQIPRRSLTSSYVDLTLKVSPRQSPEEEHRVVPQAAKSSRTLTEADIRRAVQVLNDAEVKSDMLS